MFDISRIYDYSFSNDERKILLLKTEKIYGYSLNVFFYNVTQINYIKFLMIN